MTSVSCRVQATGAEVRMTRTAGNAFATRTIVYGNRSVAVRNTGTGKEERYVLTKEDLRGILSPLQPLRAILSGNRIRLGPAVAIYALPFPGRNLFGPQTSMFEELASLFREAACDMYVVTPGDLRPDGRSVEGYRHRAGKWVKEECPWPDFVWRRMTARPIAWVGRLDEDERRLAVSHTHIGTLPRSDNDKWRVYQTLYEDPQSARYLPPTLVARTPIEAARAIGRFDDVYIKPIRGTQGKQVMRARRVAGGFLFEPPAAAACGSAADPARDVEELVRALEKRMFKGQAYLIQETVALMRTLDGRPFDLRLLIQARASGEPVCTALIARIAQKKAITTNLHTGGVPLSAERMASILAPAVRANYARGLNEARTAAAAVFDALRRMHPHMAELGIDIALDAAGQARVLEVNPCPGRRMLRLIDPALRRMSLVRVVEYAVFSTGFGLSGTILS